MHVSLFHCFGVSLDYGSVRSGSQDVPHLRNPHDLWYPRSTYGRRDVSMIVGMGGIDIIVMIVRTIVWIVWIVWNVWNGIQRHGQAKEV